MPKVLKLMNQTYNIPIDLLIAIAKTKKVVTIKKVQFLLFIRNAKLSCEKSDLLETWTYVTLEAIWGLQKTF